MRLKIKLYYFRNYINIYGHKPIYLIGYDKPVDYTDYIIGYNKTYYICG